MRKYKIIIKTPYKKKFTAEIDWESNVDELLKAFASLMVGCGYSYDNLKEILEDEWPKEEATVREYLTVQNEGDALLQGWPNSSQI